MGRGDSLKPVKNPYFTMLHHTNTLDNTGINTDYRLSETTMDNARS